MSAARFLTDFADQAVLLPTVVLVSVILVRSGWRRGALAWTVAVFGAFAATLVLKLIFSACGPLLGDGTFRSPSGHVAGAAAVYGGLAALAARRSAHRIRITLGIATAAAFAFGVSRLVLRAHTVEEVLAGACLGIAAALAFARWSAGPSPPLHCGRLALAVAAVAIVLHGLHLPAEAAIRHGARRFWPLSACMASAAGAEILRDFARIGRHEPFSFTLSSPLECKFPVLLDQKGARHHVQGMNSWLDI